MRIDTININQELVDFVIFLIFQIDYRKLPETTTEVVRKYILYSTLYNDYKP